MAQVEMGGRQSTQPHIVKGYALASYILKLESWADVMTSQPCVLLILFADANDVSPFQTDLNCSISISMKRLRVWQV